MIKKVLLEMVPLVSCVLRKQMPPPPSPKKYPTPPPKKDPQKSPGNNQYPAFVFMIRFMRWSPCTGDKKGNKPLNVRIMVVFSGVEMQDCKREDTLLKH